jgi:PIN domain nuclease of toxin-antitoxin system
MATLVHLDTHVLVWLFGGRTDLLSSLAQTLLEEGELFCSPIAALELRYLQETGRLGVSPGLVLSSLSRELGLRVCVAPFFEVVEHAYQETWTRDPFDRLIVAQARLRGARLLSKDRRIREFCESACWD